MAHLDPRAFRRRRKRVAHDRRHAVLPAWLPGVLEHARRIDDEEFSADDHRPRAVGTLRVGLPGATGPYVALPFGDAIEIIRAPPFRDLGRTDRAENGVG